MMINYWKFFCLPSHTNKDTSQVTWPECGKTRVAEDLDPLLGFDNVVNDGVEENTTNTNRTSEELHEVKRFTEDQGHADNDDDTFGCIRNGLSHGVL